jgi:hypothetical protein
MEKRYYLKISGSAWNIQADSPEAAIKQVRDYLHAYCTVSALEIGVDVDENGYDISTPLPKHVAEKLTGDSDNDLGVLVTEKQRILNAAMGVECPKCRRNCGYWNLPVGCGA